MLRNYRIYLFGAIALLAAGCHTSTSPTVVAPSEFLVTPLTANTASYGAANIDTNMQDAWGLAFNTAVGYPWIANRASGVATIYDALGVPKTIIYHVNGPGGIKGDPTGIVINSASSAYPNAFPVAAAGTNASWIFSELNGAIAAVASGSAVDSTYIVADQSANSSFTGLALVTGSSGPLLYAPNIKNGSVDQFDQNYNRTQFGGKYSTQGYTPFNVVSIDTQLFVTYAKKDNSLGYPFVAIGPGYGGYVDIYDLNGNFERNFITNDSLDEPWGVAIAPSTFGTYSGKLLVGNFGDGKIHVYDRSSGAFLGTLNDASGNAVSITGLWALVVYNNTLYYTAGPNSGKDGVFGTITVK